MGQVLILARNTARRYRARRPATNGPVGLASASLGASGWREASGSYALRPVPLDDLRKRIDELDDRILELLDQRARVVADVGRAKKDADLPTYDPDRERLILDRLRRARGAFRPRRSAPCTARS